MILEGASRAREGRRGCACSVREGARPDRTARASRASGPRLSGQRVLLPDGADIVIRPIGAEDTPLLRVTLEHLSSLSRYRRFRAPVDHISASELDEFAQADHRTREALVALDPVAAEGVGVAGYVRDAHDPSGAEVAYLVTDAWQHRGVGTALLERLAAGRARPGWIASRRRRLWAARTPAGCSRMSPTRSTSTPRVTSSKSPRRSARAERARRR